MKSVVVLILFLGSIIDMNAFELSDKEKKNADQWIKENTNSYEYNDIPKEKLDQFIREAEAKFKNDFRKQDDYLRNRAHEYKLLKFFKYETTKFLENHTTYYNDIPEELLVEWLIEAERMYPIQAVNCLNYRHIRVTANVDFYRKYIKK